MKKVWVVILLAWFATPVNADFDAGMAAYQRGDYATAFRELKPLADKGDAAAQSKLGIMYFLGNGVPQDYKKAARWLLPSAEKGGDKSAIAALAVMYLKGDGVPKDEKEAMRLLGLLEAKLDPTGAIGKEWVQQLRLGAEKGSAFAQYSLGVAYTEGKDVPQDSKEAARWLRLAADQGFVHAQVSLGVLYAKGEGIQQDYKEAALWFHLAAEQGVAEAQTNLGSLYFQGHGVTQDYKEAVRWYHLAAEQGYAQAQAFLGATYALGEWGVPQDYVQAHMWLNLAAAQGDKKASRGRDRLATEMTASQIEEAQRLAREWKPKK